MSDEEAQPKSVRAMVQRFSQFSPQEIPSLRSAQTIVKGTSEGKMHNSPARRDISASTHQNQNLRQWVYGIEEVSAMFDSLQDFLSLKEFDQELQKKLSRVYPDYKKVLNNRQADLKRKDHGIVVAGEASSGKSTLINRIIGENILTIRTLESTAAICRIRNAGTRKVEVFSDKKELCLSSTFAEDKKKEFKKMIVRYTDKKTMKKEEIQSISAVDICLPLPLLKENTVIVDTPGIGGSKELAEKMMSYLPNAVAFVFVINASNAGGMQDDRVNVILKHIGQHYKDGKMPCFDPRDVIFVINKWDCVQREIQDDLSDEDLADIEITWQEILEKINSVWQNVKSENIFKISFLSSKPEYQTEIKRFEAQLSKIIDKNCTSRLKRHFMFLQEFSKEAGRGIRARLALLNKDDETNSQSIRKYTQSIDKIKLNIKESNKSLEGEIKDVIDKLSRDFHKFITSDEGKTAILNPPNKKPIMEVCFLRLEDKVRERFQIFYKRWLTGEEVQRALSTLEDRIKTKCGHIRKSINKVESEMTQTQTQSYSDEDLEDLESSDVPFYVGVFASSPIWIPLLVVAGALCVAAAIVTSPLIIKAVVKHSSKEVKTKDINQEYQACLRSLSNETINNDLDKAYGNHYRALVSRLLDDTLTTKVSGLEFTVQQLSGHRDQIKDKQNAYRQQDEKLKKIKAD